MWETRKFVETMASFVKIAKIYTKVLEYAWYGLSGSVYGETAPLTTVWGAILGALCKLDSWVTHKFVGNTYYFGSSEQTNQLPKVLNFLMCNHHFNMW